MNAYGQKIKVLTVIGALFLPTNVLPSWRSLGGRSRCLWYLLIIILPRGIYNVETGAVAGVDLFGLVTKTVKKYFTYQIS